VGAYRDAILALDPAGYWPGDDADGSPTLEDVSGHGRHATYLNGSHLRGDSALEEGGFGLDGNGSRIARVPLGSWMDDFFLGSYTALVWFRTPNTAPANQSTRRMMGRNRGPGGADERAAHGLALVGSQAFGDTSGRVLFYTGSQQDVNAAFTDGVDFYRDDAWHFFAGVRDGSSIGLYLDGARVVLRTEPLSPLATAYPFGILGQGGSGYDNEAWMGGLDEPALIPEPLNAAEIRELFCLGRPSTCSGWSVGHVGIG
jgi:hypothetical protein